MTVTERSYRVVRGSTRGGLPRDVRSAFRYWLSPDGTWDFIGFRIVYSSSRPSSKGKYSIIAEGLQ